MAGTPQRRVEGTPLIGVAPRPPWLPPVGRQLPAPAGWRGPGQPPRRSRRGLLLGIGAIVAVLAIGVTAIAFWPSGTDETRSWHAERPEPDGPRRTLPPPVIEEEQPVNDRRIIVGEPPAGFQLADLIEGEPGYDDTDWLYPTTPVMFNAPDATYADGAFVHVYVDPGWGELPPDWFGRPARSVDVNGRRGLRAPVRQGMLGTVFLDGDDVVNVVSAGLDLAQHESVANSVEVAGGTVTVANGALPPGVVEVDGADYARFENHLYGTSWEAGNAYYYGPDGYDLLDAAVVPVDADDIDRFAEGVRFFLAHAETVLVRGVTATVGTYEPGVEVITWLEGDLQVTLMGRGVGRDELVAAAGTVHLGGDADWADDEWDAALADVERYPADGFEQGPDPVGDVDGGTLSVGGLWTVNAETEAGVEGPAAVHWRMRVSGATGEDLVGQTEDVTSTAPSIQLSWVSTWELEPRYYVAALAIGGIELRGASLRLTADGDPNAPLLVELHPVVGLEGLVMAGAVTQWTSTFTAELVAADGTVLATVTDLDCV